MPASTEPGTDPLLDAFPASAAVLDRQGVIVQVNRAWRAFGRANGLTTQDAGVGVHYLDLCAAAAEPSAHEAGAGIARVLNGEVDMHLQVYPCHSPDQERWFELKVSSVRDGTGRVMLLHEDVTARVAAEQELERRTAFLRDLTASSPDALQVLAPDGTLLWTNGVGQSMLAGDASGGARHLTSLWPPEIRPAVQEALNTAARGGRGHFEGQVPLAGGGQAYWDVVVSPIHGPGGGITHLVATARDMTALQAVRQDMLHQAQETARILSSIQEAFFAVDEQWRFTYLNPRAETLLGCAAPELLGREIWQVFPEALERCFVDRYREVVRAQRSVSFKEYYPPLDRWFGVNAYPHGAGVAVYFQDITARKAEEQAQQIRNEILEMIVQDRPLEEILDRLAGMVEGQLPGHRCTVMQINDAELERADGCRAAISRGGVTVAEDLLLRPGCLACRLPASGLQGACASLALLDGRGAVLGALAVHSPVPGPFPGEVLAALHKARHLAAVAIEHHRLTGQLWHQANHDALTGLANRPLYEKTLSDALGAARRQGAPVSLLFIDVDEFKDVNDNYGHPVGDIVLRTIAERLRTCARPSDTLARISGDEFTMVMPDTDALEAQAVAQRIHESLAHPVLLPDSELFVTASIGISATPEGGRDPASLQRSADLALYAAKRRKPASVIFHQDLADQASERFRLAAYLRRAVDLGELELHYQPVVDLRSGQVTGAEALVRWRHPELGLVSPAAFIPIAEQSGLIIPIGEWVLREACRQGAAWWQAGRPLHMAVNVSAVQLADPEFVATVEASLQEAGLPPGLLELELTERVVMSDVEESVSRMERLRQLGVTLAVDDFGTGYSSLSYLPRLPLNTLKIDRSFVKDLYLGSPTYAVVRAIVSLAQSLDLDVLAEGVETEAELAVLRDLGCQLAQGYLFGRPLPATDPAWSASPDPLPDMVAFPAACDD